MAGIHDPVPTPDQQALIGTWRRLGTAGPVYEIVGFDRYLDDGDWMMRIRILESAEEVDYKLTDLQADPVEV